MMTPQNIAEEPRVHDNEVRFFRMPDLPAFTSHYLSVPETPSSKPFLLTAAEDDSFCTYNSTSIGMYRVDFGVVVRQRDHFGLEFAGNRWTVDTASRLF